MAEATYYPVRDATISETVPDTNLGTGREAGIYHYCGMETKLLGNSIPIRIDFSALTGTITAAEFRLYVASSVHNGGGDVTNMLFYFRRCRRDGDESAAWLESQVTYNSFKTDNPWGTAGAENTTTDVDTADQVWSVGVSTTNTWWNTDVTTMVQDMYTNHGKIFDIVVDGNFADLPGEDDQAFMKIATRDSVNYKPRLVITYTPAVTFVPQVIGPF